MLQLHGLKGNKILNHLYFAERWLLNKTIFNSSIDKPTHEGFDLRWQILC